MADTSIQWCDRVWNPVRGCSLKSKGCMNCYAMKQAHRFSGPGGLYEGLTKLGPNGPTWTGKIRLVPEKLDEPLRRRKPTTYFVNSMSDLFHEDVPESYIAAVFGVMAVARWHTYQVLTKRARRMAEVVSGLDLGQCLAAIRDDERFVRMGHESRRDRAAAIEALYARYDRSRMVWPLPNVWLGVSVEDQARADERIPHLLRVPAAVRFLSVEPLLGEVSIGGALMPECDNCGFPVDNCNGDEIGRWCQRCGREDIIGIDWVIVGGESGPGARPCDVAWIRSIVRQCQAAGTTAFVKQVGANVQARNDEVADWFGSCGHLDMSPTERFQGAIGRVRGFRDSKGGDPGEWPSDLRVRELPATVGTMAARTGRPSSCT